MQKIRIGKVSKNHKGRFVRGMFATAKIRKGEVIEVCPVIVLPLKDKKALEKTLLFDYYFYWGAKNQPAIVLGYGSIYNHSYKPNAEYDQNVKKQTMTFRALRDIKPGEEIRTNYNGDPDNQDELWFNPKPGV